MEYAKYPLRQDDKSPFWRLFIVDTDGKLVGAITKGRIKLKNEDGVERVFRAKEIRLSPNYKEGCLPKSYNETREGGKLQVELHCQRWQLRISSD